MVIRENREAVMRSRMTMKSEILNLTVVKSDVFISALIVLGCEKYHTLNITISGESQLTGT
jgi:uncharacterized protein YpuA (DUF1002 family)